MSSLRSQRETLLELTINAAARLGLDGISLRGIAAEAEASTTAIFQNYSGKSELVADAVRAAIAQDDAFHQDLREQAFGLIRGHLAFADFIACYVELRAVSAHARFLAEVIVKAQAYPQCFAALRQWRGRRQEFWAELIALQEVSADLAAIVGDYVLMEEFYAHALMEQMQYRLLLRESARALCEAAFHDGRGGGLESNVSLTLGINPFSARGPSTGDGHAAAGQLLDAAMQIINRVGVGGINQRAIARAVGVSPSMITYHFNDMKTFTTQAIWRALVQGIPVQLDPDHESEELPRDLPEWLGILDNLLQPGQPGRDAGFYVGFSRLTGEACLMARRNPALLPLIIYLRGLEGWGTYRVSRAIEPLARRIGRDHASAFGIWIKAEAMLRSSGLVDSTRGIDRLTTAARLIFPS
jgi:AcrR family transcriptional regulator